MGFGMRNSWLTMGWVNGKGWEKREIWSGGRGAHRVLGSPGMCTGGNDQAAPPRLQGTTGPLKNTRGKRGEFRGKQKKGV